MNDINTIREQRRECDEFARSLGGKLGDTLDFRDPRDHLERMRQWEMAGPITHRQWLARHGLVFAPPGTLPPDRLSVELARLIDALELARVFLTGTDHLSDVELYDKLHADVLEGEEPDVPRMENEAFHWDLSEMDNPDSPVWLSFYADDLDRDEYRHMNPGRRLPPRRKLLVNRDETLPKP